MPVPLLPQVDQRSAHHFHHLLDAFNIDGLLFEAFDPQLRADARVEQEKISRYVADTIPRDDFNPLLGLFQFWYIDYQRSGCGLTVSGVIILIQLVLQLLVQPVVPVGDRAELTALNLQDMNLVPVP